MDTSNKLPNIPFSPPRMDQKILDEVCAALKSGWITTGPRTKEFEKKIDPSKLPAVIALEEQLSKINEEKIRITSTARKRKKNTKAKSDFLTSLFLRYLKKSLTFFK